MSRSRLWPLALLLSLSCSAESQICGRMETLCGTERPSCHDLVVQTKEAFGDQGVTDLKACFSTATTCSEATGCAAGKGLKAAGAAIEGFFKGLVKGLDDKK
jgi:hypothetical protein